MEENNINMPIKNYIKANYVEKNKIEKKIHYLEELSCRVPVDEYKQKIMYQIKILQELLEENRDGI